MQRIGISKPHWNEWSLRTLLGDVSAPDDLDQDSILQQFDQYVRLGEDIICDFRENNGRIPTYDAFWNIFDEYFQNKRVINDQQHEVDGRMFLTMIIATMAIATSWFPAMCKTRSFEKFYSWSSLKTMILATGFVFF